MQYYFLYRQEVHVSTSCINKNYIKLYFHVNTRNMIHTEAKNIRYYFHVSDKNRLPAAVER